MDILDFSLQHTKLHIELRIVDDCAELIQTLVALIFQIGDSSGKRSHKRTFVHTVASRLQLVLGQIIPRCHLGTVHHIGRHVGRNAIISQSDEPVGQIYLCLFQLLGSLLHFQSGVATIGFGYQLSLSHPAAIMHIHPLHYASIGKGKLAFLDSPQLAIAYQLAMKRLPM